MSETTAGAYPVGPRPPPWGWPIALDFSLSAASAGTFAMAAVARLFGGRAFEWTVDAAAMLALPLVTCSLALLVYDLGRPARFFRMLLAFNPTSPMSWGSWLLTIYAGLCAALLGATVLRPWPDARVALLAAGLPFALAVLAYKGILLHATEVAVWRRGVLFAPALLCGGLALGVALLIVVAAAAGRSAPALTTPLLALALGQAAAVALQARRLGRDGFTLLLARAAAVYWICGAALAIALAMLGAALPAALATIAGGVALRRALVDAPRARERWSVGASR